MDENNDISNGIGCLLIAISMAIIIIAYGWVSNGMPGLH